MLFPEFQKLGPFRRASVQRPVGEKNDGRQNRPLVVSDPAAQFANISNSLSSLSTSVNAWETA
jgi:hypothetical protein